MGAAVAAVMGLAALAMFGGKKRPGESGAAVPSPAASSAGVAAKIPEAAASPSISANEPKPAPTPLVATVAAPVMQPVKTVAPAKAAAPAPHPARPSRSSKPIMMPNAGIHPPSATVPPKVASAQAAPPLEGGDSAKPAAEPPSILPPELAALNRQFLALQAERVTQPYETDVAKFNAGYLGGIDKAIAAEKAAGHLDAILALEAEKNLIAANQPVPKIDDPELPKALIDLRAIYRAAHDKLASARTANLRALTDPLDARLRQMETDLTKADRLEDAKKVRGYRETLAENAPAAAPAPAAGTPPAASAPGQSHTTVNPAALLAARGGIANSLDMKFVPVPGTKVLFCVHETRYKDYAAFAAAASGIAPNWKTQTLEGYALTQRAEDHPVVSVSWEDAKAFCLWLSKKEGKTYRLPTDREWSLAVGIGREENWTEATTPEMLNRKVKDEFPWGGRWPPPKGAGNYSDQSRKAKAPNASAVYLEEFDDSFPTTAPVMSFKPNRLGIFDLGGNVWEWCEDWFDTSKTDRVLRGGAWSYGDDGSMSSSSRVKRPSSNRSSNGGFRCVLEVAAAP